MEHRSGSHAGPGEVNRNETVIDMNSPVSSQRRYPTLADAAMVPRFDDDRTPLVLARLVLVLAGSALLAISAQIKIPLYPVPVTGQTLVVLMIGMAYGSRLGAATLLAYLVEGGMGLPVFAGGGAGWATLAGPTGGYLIGFLVAAFILGLLAERGMGRGPVSTALAMIVGTALIYMFGVTHLSGFIGFEKAVAAGLLPFLYGDALKLIVAAGLMPLAWRGVRALTAKDGNAAD